MTLITFICGDFPSLIEQSIDLLFLEQARATQQPEIPVAAWMRSLQGECLAVTFPDCGYRLRKRGKYMVAIQTEYQGDLHCHVVHGPSGTALDTDAPVDNHGK